MRTTVLLIVVAAVLTLASLSTAKDDPFVGTWKLKKGHHSDGGVLLGSYTGTYIAVEGGQRMSSDSIDADGEITHTEYTARYDGKEYPVSVKVDGKEPPGIDITVALNRIDARTIEVIFKHSGKPFMQGRAVISEDGRTMTRIYKETNETGEEFTITSVLEKQ